MRFRTEIEPVRGTFCIEHTDSILMLGSCFTDHIGERLRRDGFDVCFNPLGPLYNPLSLGRLINDLLEGKRYTSADFTIDDDGINHCLDFASRYQDADAVRLASSLNDELTILRSKLDKAAVVIITFGSSFVYTLDGSLDSVVGNCHKFPGTKFTRIEVEATEIVARWTPLLNLLRVMDKKIIFTVSPIRHLADGLHGNELSKARLLLALDRLSGYSDYFPSYEIMIDDLRDYRFYESDMKHPSSMACDYIYEKFCDSYFSRDTLDIARCKRAESLMAAHRPILS